MHCGDQRHAGLCLGRRPCMSCSQGTILSALDLHSAWATILNPFYNMEYEIIKKIRQNKTWNKADILCINLTPNWYNALASAVVYVSNDVTFPFNTMIPEKQQKIKNLTASMRDRDRNCLKSTDRRSNITLISSCPRAKPWMFESRQSDEIISVKYGVFYCHFFNQK